MNDGYIKLWRKVQKTSFYKHPLVCHLAIHLIMEANHKPRKVLLNRQEIIIERGQLIAGRKTLSAGTGLTQQNVRTSLKILSNIGFLTSKSTNRFSILTICKYNDYQGLVFETNQLTNQHLTSTQPALNQHLTTLNKNKNVKNDKNIYNNRGIFKEPTIDEIKAYCLERKNNVNPEKWLAHYQAKGWVIGKTKMKDWKAAVRTWENNTSLPVKQESPYASGLNEKIKKMKAEVENGQ